MGCWVGPSWAGAAGRRAALLGHFDPSHNAIIISRIFDPGRKCRRPPLEYVMFHEMLHLRHPVDHRGARRRVIRGSFARPRSSFRGLRRPKKR